MRGTLRSIVYLEYDRASCGLPRCERQQSSGLVAINYEHGKEAMPRLGLAVVVCCHVERLLVLTNLPPAGGLYGHRSKE